MDVVVQKYGGSSVADLPRLEGVADRIARSAGRGERVCTVVSAMGRTTDDLLALARQVTDAPPRRELDMLVSTGERIAMALLAMAIQKRGLEAISFTGSQSGIITNDRHSDAQIIEVRPVRIQDELSRGKVVIVAGFPGDVLPPRDHHPGPRGLGRHGRGPGFGPGRLLLRDLLGRGRRLYRRSTAGAGSLSAGENFLRGNAGAGRPRRPGPERAGRGVGPQDRGHHPHQRGPPGGRALPGGHPRHRSASLRSDGCGKSGEPAPRGTGRRVADPPRAVGGGLQAMPGGAPKRKPPRWSPPPSFPNGGRFALP